MSGKFQKERNLSNLNLNKLNSFSPDKDKDKYSSDGELNFNNNNYNNNYNNNNYNNNQNDLNNFDKRSNEEFEKNRSANKFYTINANNNELRNKRNYSQTTKHGKLDRVRQLSEKLSKLQITETPNPAKLNKLEAKFQQVEENTNYNLGTLKTKYNTLKEHTEKMKGLLETETLNKDDLRKNISERLRNLQTRVKTYLLEEKEHFKEYTENITNKLEAELIKCETDVKRDEDMLLKNLTDIKDNIRV